MTIPERCSILIVYDDPELAQYLQVVLEEQRKDAVHWATNAEEAWTWIGQNPPNLIFTNILIPPSLDASDFYQQLGERWPSLRIPVIVFGALHSEDYRAKVKERGMAGYLCMPRHPKDFIIARDKAIQGETYFPPLA
jgi:DNA-binding NarL/FixJ family response regulator